MLILILLLSGIRLQGFQIPGFPEELLGDGIACESICQLLFIRLGGVFDASHGSLAATFALALFVGLTTAARAIQNARGTISMTQVAARKMTGRSRYLRTTNCPRFFIPWNWRFFGFWYHFQTFNEFSLGGQAGLEKDFEAYGFV